MQKPLLPAFSSSHRDYENILPKDGETFYLPGFFAEKEASLILRQLSADVLWRQEPVRIFGKWVMQPRLIAWFSAANMEYQYSGLKLTPLPFPPLLRAINQRLIDVVNLTFNSALLNLYRNGNDSMGWHRDNERVLGNQPIIASLSFGATRLFRMRHYQEKNLQISLPLQHGSLLLMRGDTQEYWSHCLPKTKKVHETRINVTLRNLQQIEGKM